MADWAFAGAAYAFVVVALGAYALTLRARIRRARSVRDAVARERATAALPRVGSPDASAPPAVAVRR